MEFSPTEVIFDDNAIVEAVVDTKPKNAALPKESDVA